MERRPADPRIEAELADVLAELAPFGGEEDVHPHAEFAEEQKIRRHPDLPRLPGAPRGDPVNAIELFGERHLSREPGREKTADGRRKPWSAWRRRGGGSRLRPKAGFTGYEQQGDE